MEVINVLTHLQSTTERAVKPGFALGSNFFTISIVLWWHQYLKGPNGNVSTVNILSKMTKNYSLTQELFQSNLLKNEKENEN